MAASILNGWTVPGGITDYAMVDQSSPDRATQGVELTKFERSHERPSMAERMISILRIHDLAWKGLESHIIPDYLRLS